MTDSTTTSPANLTAPVGNDLWTLREFSNWLREQLPGQKGLRFEALRLRKHEFTHIQIGKSILLTAAMRQEFLDRYTKTPAKPVDKLDATRERVARKRSRTAPTQRGRKAA